MRIWNLETGSVIELAHLQLVRFAAFSPDGRRVVTCVGDELLRSGEARLWDAESGAPIGEPMAHAEPVTFASFSSDGTLVATASVDNTARVWSASDGKPLVESLDTVHSADLTSVRFSPDGRQLVTASYDSTAVIFDWAAGRTWRNASRCATRATSTTPSSARTAAAWLRPVSTAPRAFGTPGAANSSPRCRTPAMSAPFCSRRRVSRSRP